MRAHLVQMDIAWEDKTANHLRARDLIRKNHVRPGDLVILPEMFDTGFSFNLEITADTDGATLTFLRGLAAEFKITLQGARTALGTDGRGRNRASILGPDGAVLAEYDKIHPFSYGRESERFTGGDAVVTYTWTQDPAQSVVVCPAICYDLRFPELFRRGLLAGAELFAVGANWPAPRAPHRCALLIARAIENQAYVLGVNRAGRDPHLEYCGGSLAVGPKGEIIGELGDVEGVLSVEIDPAAVRAWRNTFPAWKDHRLLSAPRPPGRPLPSS